MYKFHIYIYINSQLCISVMCCFCYRGTAHKLSPYLPAVSAPDELITAFCLL